MRRQFILFLLMLWSSAGGAHQLQGVALNLQEQGNDRVQASLKLQLRRDGQPLNLLPVLSPACNARGQASFQRLDQRILRQWTLHCPGDLKGRSLRMTGLGPAAPEAIISIGFADGHTQTAVVDREHPQMRIGQAAESTGPGGLVAYFPIGVEHILLGPDHLLFVLCLLLVIQLGGGGWRALLATITAFTLAHSLTLGLAVLANMRLPSAPVEAVIALSILLLAVELARQQRNPQTAPGLSLRYPALVAFAFGLLHGFGFAGALTEIGLPGAARGWALLLFNLGVEAGQLLFVAGVMALAWVAGRGLRLPIQALAGGLVTVTGIVSAFWFIDRLQPVLGL